MAQLDAPVRALLEGPNCCTVATLRSDGSIQANVVWVHTDGDHVLLNTADGRAWPANLRRDPRCTVTVYPADDPYEYASVRGTAELTPDGADESIDFLAQKYLGQETYPFRQPGEQRLVVRVAPDAVHYSKQG